MSSPVAEEWPADRDVPLYGEGDGGEAAGGEGDLGQGDQVGDAEDQNLRKKKEGLYEIVQQLSNNCLFFSISLAAKLISLYDTC